MPSAEIRAAIIALLNLHHGATKTEIPTEVARQFGFKSTGATRPIHSRRFEPDVNAVFYRS